MSSNAFARSRPRVRHQRVPRTHSCDHPRFLQLVNELARLNEAKKKQEELEGGCSTSAGGCAVELSNNGDHGPVSICNNGGNSIGSCGEGVGPGGGGSGDAGSIGPNIINNGLSSGSICSASSITGASCCNISPVCEAQTSNGYRSLDNNQSSTSASHDNYHHQHQQQNHQIHIQHPHQHPNLHHHNIITNNNNNNNNHHHHHNHHSGVSHLDSQQQHISNNFQQQQLHQNDRCPSKSSSTTSYVYSKQNIVAEHNNNPSAFSSNNNNHSDLNRQDENRSKRKRSTNDSSTNSRQKNSTSCSSGASKRLKSSPEAIRPLSPSFTKCPICLLDCMDRDPSFTNTCFHLFCYVCIENWTKNKATCPLCRTKFTKIIYNIKSSTNYEEKIASPIRREEDEYISDRLMLEHLSGLNPNSTVSSRNANSDDVQFLFENIRNPEALIPRYFVNQIDPRQESIHSFNTVTGFDSNVPQPPFNSYPMTSNYLIFQQANGRIPSSIPSTAISGAYTANTSLTSSNNDPNSSRRISSRSSRSFYPRIYEPQSVDTPFRVSRVSNTSSNSNQPAVTMERGHHHHHHPHQHQHQHQQHHQAHTTHRSPLDLNPAQTRQSQRFEQSHIHLGFPSYSLPARHYNPNAYRSSRPYTNQEHQYIIDTFPRPSPDM